MYVEDYKGYAIYVEESETGGYPEVAYNATSNPIDGFGEMVGLYAFSDFSSELAVSRLKSALDRL